jgi:predicted nucleic acid-binding protein
MAVTFILDTSAYSEFKRGDHRLNSWITGENTILVPYIVVGELKAGFAAGNRQQDNLLQLERFLQSPNVSVINLSEAQTSMYGNLYATLRQTGKHVGTNDMWIASAALETGNMLLTVDSDFRRIPGLKLAEL